jgi:electron-transferring-flavoprotein dehydrogenase
MEGFPLKTRVKKEGVYFLTEHSALKFPIQPPPLKDHGLYAGSLSKLVRWLAKLCEDEGLQIFPGFAAARALYDGDRVIGVRTGDKGVSHGGKKKPNFEPGMDLRAKVTVMSEGSRGNVTRDIIRKLKLDEGKNPQNYAIGVKEIIEVPEGQAPAGEVALTMGWPLDSKTFGGAFLYTLEDNLVSLGLVIGLDYRDPNLDPQIELQRLKMHPLMQKYVAGGKVVQYGAKTIPEGGWFSLPRPYADGLLLTGDCGGFLNGERLKGVHLAIKTGKLAADVIFECLLEGDTSAVALSRFQKLFDESAQGKELYKARNFHIEFEGGLYNALAKGGMNFALGGGTKKARPTHDDYKSYLSLAQVGGARVTNADIPYDRTLFLDKLSDVYLAGSNGEEDQPSHLQVEDTSLCWERCAEEYGNPCTKACPANVYEMVDDDANPGKKRLHLNPTNCVHCKTCDLIDPYLNIRWVVPEGGDGPHYTQM